MDVYQINQTLEDHRLWLETDGNEGARMNFARVKLEFADLRKADLRKANLQGASLVNTDLRETKLQGANLIAADLTNANLAKADLQGAELNSARLIKANMAGADLRGACLMCAELIGTDFRHANLSGCSVYGTSVWSLKVNNETIQSNLIITPLDEPAVVVDDLEVGQFIYLLLRNEKIRNVIGTIGKKAVLILGRFTTERKSTLDALREELRKSGFVPILFDFDKPGERDLTETVSTLAHLACFVIADLTDAKSVPQELQKIIPNLPSVPVQPIIHESQHEYGMFKDFGGYLSVSPPYRYKDTDELLASLVAKIINPAVQKLEAIAERRREFEKQSKMN